MTAVEYKVKNKLRAPEPASVRIEGSVGEQMNKFFQNRIFSDYARGSIYRETEDAFRNQIDDARAVGLWQGEFWGKWVIGAARACRYTGDGELKDFLSNAAHTLLSLARDDGYIGTYKDSSNMLAVDPEIGRAVVGWPCSWNWNVWCRKYTLWGLLEIYMLTEEEDILSGARKFAGQLIDELSSLGYHLTDVGIFNGLPAGSILKPMLMLYRLTGDEKYLSFCLSEVALWEREDGTPHNLVKNFLDEKPIHTWYENPNEWAKAYELMSCLEGICELYRITGDEKYLTVCKNAHRLIKKYEMNSIFGVTVNDMFFNAAEYMNSCTEPCDVIHWMRLCYELYLITGESEYLEDFEASFYNPFLASSYSDGTWGARGVRSSGRHMTLRTQARMLESHCCVNNIPRGYMDFVESVIALDGNALYLNMFSPFSADVVISEKCRASISVGEGMLEYGRVSVSTFASAPFELKIRIPEWSGAPTVTYDGVCYKPTEKGYFSVAVNGGEAVVDIDFDISAKILEFSGSFVDSGERSYATDRFVSNNYADTVVPYSEMLSTARARVLYGPLLLARSLKCGSTVDELKSEGTVAGGGYTASVTPLKPNGTRVKFNVRFERDGDAFDTLMCDYATGSNEYFTRHSHLFSIWV